MSGVEWAPSLPAGWDGSSLRWLAEIYAGGTPSKNRPEYWLNGTIPWLNSGSVNDWSVTSPSALITPEAYSGSSAKWIPAKSVLVALAGQGKTKGMAARLEIDSTCNQSIAAIVPGGKLDYSFLHFWLAANYQNIRNMAGGDKRDGLNLVHIGSIEIPVPPLDEQQAIAEYLDREALRIDELIAEQRGLIELLRERKKSFAERFYGVRVGDGARLRWSLMDVDERAGGMAVDLPLLSVSIDWGVRRRRAGDSKQAEGDLAKYKIARRGDIVLNRMRAFQGALGVASEDGVVSPDYSVIRMTIDVDSSWLSAVMRSPVFVGEMVSRIRGIGGVESGATRTPRLNFGDLREIRVDIPDVKQQRAEVEAALEKTSRIDALIAESEDLITLSQERRVALITAAVTGQIDVRSAA